MTFPKLTDPIGNITQHIELSIYEEPSKRSWLHIAMGVFVTSPQFTEWKKVGFVDNLKRSKLFNAFVPSLCPTLIGGYHYILYLVVEMQLLLAITGGLSSFIKTANATFHEQPACASKHLSLNISILTIAYTNNHIQAVNDGMSFAYLRGANYFYKLDDRVMFTSGNWTTTFIRSLWHMPHRNLGVVGPTFTFNIQAVNDGMSFAHLRGANYLYKLDDRVMFTSGNWTTTFIRSLWHMPHINLGVVGPRLMGSSTDILSYSFTHSTHLDLFSYYSPDVTLEWLSDAWLTRVYGPDSTLSVRGITMLRTPQEGHTKVITSAERLNQTIALQNEIQKGSVALKSWLDADIHNCPTVLTPPNEKNKFRSKYVISICLTGYLNQEATRVLQNIDHLRHWFPHWMIRVYIENPSCCKYSKVDPRIINYLTHTGAELVYVNTNLLDV